MPEGSNASYHVHPKKPSAQAPVNQEIMDALWRLGRWLYARRQTAWKALKYSSVVAGILAGAVVIKSYQHPRWVEDFQPTIDVLDAEIAASKRAWETKPEVNPDSLALFMEWAFPSGFIPYDVRKWQRLIQIAEEHQLDVEGLFYINVLFRPIISGTPKAPRLVAGQQIMVPVSSEELTKSLHILKAAYAARNTENPARQIVPFYPSSPRQLGFSESVERLKRSAIERFTVQQQRSADTYRQYKINLEYVPENYDLLRKHELLMEDPNLPRILDESNEKDVNCASWIRALMRQSVDQTRITPQWKAFFAREGIDAWKFGRALMELGFIREYNDLMLHMDRSQLMEFSPLRRADEHKYYARIREMLTDLDSRQAVGSILPMYFMYSKFKSKMYSELKKQEKIEGTTHYNTHQTIYAGNGTLSLRAGNVPRVKTSRTQHWPRLLEHFITDFIVMRLSFGGSRESYEAYERVLKSLAHMSGILSIVVNGKTYDVGAYMASGGRLLVDDTDNVEFIGPMIEDAEHPDGGIDLLGYHASRMWKMTSRVRFVAEMLGVYLITEVFVPGEEVQRVLKSGVPEWNVVSYYSLRKATDPKRLKEVAIPTIERTADDVSAQIDPSCDVYEIVPHSENLQQAMWKHFCTSPEYQTVLNKPIAERRAFFDRNIYPKQIQALQVLGFLPYGEAAARIVVNQMVPFIGNTPAEVRQLEQTAIKDRLEPWRRENAQLPISQKYAFVYALPNISDTPQRVFRQMVLYISATPGLSDLGTKLLSLDSVAVDSFLRQLLSDSVSTDSIWTKKRADDFFARRIRSGDVMWFDIDLVRNALKVVTHMSAFGRTPDDRLIEQLITLKVDDTRMKQLLMRIYISENSGSYTDTWACVRGRDVSELYSCLIGGREGVKRLLQDIDNGLTWPLAGKHITNSLGDLQLRLGPLEEWAKTAGPWKTAPWPEREVLRKALASAQELSTTPGLAESLASDDWSAWKSDQALVERLHVLIETDSITPDQKQELILAIRSLMRISRHGSDALLGRAFSLPLMESKIRGHITHLGGVFKRIDREDELQKAHADSSEHGTYPDYERILMMINNQGETNVMYFMAQLYIQRLHHAIIEHWEGYHEFPSIAGVSISQKLRGAIAYDASVAQRHLQDLQEAIALRVQFLTDQPAMMRSAWMRQWLHEVDADGQYLLDKLRSFSYSHQPLNDLYSLLGDVRLRKALRDRGFSDALLPSWADIVSARTRTGNEGFEAEFLWYAKKSEQEHP